MYFQEFQQALPVCPQSTAGNNSILGNVNSHSLLQMHHLQQQQQRLLQQQQKQQVVVHDNASARNERICEFFKLFVNLILIQMFYRYEPRYFQHRYFVE